MTSRTRYLAVIGASAAALTAVAVGAANAGGSSQTPPPAETETLPLVALLNGENEVDNTGTPNQGDLDAAGYAVVEVDRAGRQVCVRELQTGGIDGQIHLFHIHSAPGGQNGPVVVDFVPLLATGGVGCVPVADKTLLSDISLFPAEYYVNVHSTPDFPAGAVRGQLQTLASLPPLLPPPDTSVPDTSTPDTSAPDTSAPDTSHPDTSHPDTSAPDTSGPDTSGPDTSGPDGTRPYSG
jgi:CHRD domain